MTDDNIKQKVLALLNEVQAERGRHLYRSIDRECSIVETLYRAIKQREAYEQKVSDVILKFAQNWSYENFFELKQFIIPKPKPDPLVEVMREATAKSSICENDFAANIRAALEARGLEIREKGQ